MFIGSLEGGDTVFQGFREFVEVGNFVLLGLSEDVLNYFVKIQVDFKISLVDGLDFFDEIFNDECQIVH
jgi:hypothetical protein